MTENTEPRRGYDPAKVVAIVLAACTRRGLRPAPLTEAHAGRAVRAAAALLRAIGVVPLAPDGTEYTEETP